jgi:hypothetical protein
MRNFRRPASLANVSMKRMEVRRADHRDDTRLATKEAVALRFRNCTRIVTVMNRSTGGLLVRLPTALRIGEQVRITFPGGRSREGIVCWYHSEKAGIHLL